MWREAGLTRVLLGVESGSNRILKNMDKPVSPEKNLMCINNLNKIGVSIHSTFIVGYPGETHDTINETVAFMNQYPEPIGEVENSFGILPFYVISTSICSTKKERMRWGLNGIGTRWAHNTMTYEEAVCAGVEMKFRINRLFSPYKGFEDEETGLTLEIANARMKLCRMEFYEQGITTSDAWEVRSAWEQLKQAVKKIM